MPKNKPEEPGRKAGLFFARSTSLTYIKTQDLLSFVKSIRCVGRHSVWNVALRADAAELDRRSGREGEFDEL